MHYFVQIIFLWMFPYKLLYFASKLKKSTILSEIVSFFWKLSAEYYS